MRRRHVPLVGWTLLVGVLAAGALLGMEARRLRLLYWYDVQSSYQYQFTGAGIQRVLVSISDGVFSMPDVEPGWKAAALGVHVRSSAASMFAEPAITVTPGTVPSCVQYFERRARGRRLLDLCAAEGDLRTGDPVRLKGSHAEVPDQEAELFLFASPLTEDARLLVLAPHPDDAEIAAFGLLSGRDSWIITVTTGSYGGSQYAELVPDARARDSLQASLRTWNSAAAVLWAGLPAERAINLGYPTFSLEQMFRDQAGTSKPAADVRTWRTIRVPGAAALTPTATWKSYVEDLKLLIEQLRPQVIIMPHPALDDNRDHVFVAAGVLQAVEELGDPPVDFLLYTNHHVLSEYYPFGPVDGAVAPPPWFDACVPMGSVVIHRLTAQEKVAKLFALEAMHDLRKPPRMPARSPLKRAFVQVRDGVAGFARDPVQDLSYFRRAVRPTELFLAYSAADRPDLQRLLDVAAKGGWRGTGGRAEPCPH